MTNWLLNLIYLGKMSKKKLERVEEYLSKVRELGVDAGYNLEKLRNPGKLYIMYFQSKDFSKIIGGRDGLVRILGKPTKIELKVK